MIASAIGRPSDAGAGGRGGIAADRDPDRAADPEWAADRSPTSSSGARWRPAQRDVLRLAQPEQKVELLGEQLVVVGEVVAEERERLDERAAPRHDLRAPAGEQIEGGELLEDAHRIVRAEHADRAREPDPRRPLGDGSERDRRRGDGEVGAMVLADPEDVEPDLVGERRLLDQVAQTLRGRDRPSRGRVGRELREGVETEFHVRLIEHATI